MPASDHNPETLLREGKIDALLELLTAAARNDPADVPTRLYLSQLLCVNNDWDRAAKQFAALAKLSPEAQMLTVVYNQAIAAERQREAVMRGAVEAAIHGECTWASGVAHAMYLDANGKSDESVELREKAFAAAPDTPGTLNGEQFEWIADADPTFGPCLEAIIDGTYGLLPFELISKLTTEGPKDLRDLVWLPVEIAFKNGRSAAAFIPARYPKPATDPAERLARATSWDEDGAGRGQRIFHLSNGNQTGALALRTLAFD